MVLQMDISKRDIQAWGVIGGSVAIFAVLAVISS